MAATVLVVEDEEAIASVVRAYLERDGYRVQWVGSGQACLDALAREPAQLVVLDIGLPDFDGFEVCRRIRTRSQVPIIMLTARDEEVDRVAGLEVGADDYVAKPFSPRELVAGLKPILRRPDPGPRKEVLRLGAVGRWRRAREARWAGRRVGLT